MVIGTACVAFGAPLPGAALLLLAGLESSVHRTPTPTPTPTPARAPTPRAYAGTLLPGAALLTLTPSVTVTPTLSRHAAARCRASHLGRTRGSHAAGLGGRAHCWHGAARYADTAHCTLHATHYALHAAPQPWRAARTGCVYRRPPIPAPSFCAPCAPEAQGSPPRRQRGRAPRRARGMPPGPDLPCRTS